MDMYLLYDKFVEIVVVLIENVMVSGFVGFSEDKSFYDVIGDVVREIYVNGGESFILERGGIGNGVDFFLSEDCSVFVFEVIERFEILFIKGVNDSSISVL